MVASAWASVCGHGVSPSWLFPTRYFHNPPYTRKPRTTEAGVDNPGSQGLVRACGNLLMVV